MKNLYIYLFLIVFQLPSLYAQDEINIGDASSVNTCDANFYDSGGPDGTYSSINNESSETITICPEGDMRVRIEFTEFIISGGGDFLYIYDGDSTGAPLIDTYTGSNSPGVIIAGDNNPTGCLTFEFIADGEFSPLAGWESIITCVEPCQDINPSVSSIVPADLNGGMYTAYFGEELTFNGDALFSNSSNNATYTWDFGDSQTGVGQTTTHSYQELGVFDVELTVTDEFGCSNSVVVQVEIIINEEDPGPGCPNIAVDPGLTVEIGQGGEVIIPCNEECTTLTASYLNTGATTSYAVESIPYSPPFPFTGATGNVQDINSDDDWSEVINLGFDFCFFDETYNDVLITDNGALTFSIEGIVPGGVYEPSSGSGYAYNETIPFDAPDTSPPYRNAIFGVLQDLHPGSADSPDDYSINYELIGSSPCRTLVFNIYKLPHYQCGDDLGLQTSQMVIYETTNVIEVYVKNRTSCSFNSGSGLIGIQNQAGTVAFTPPGRNTGTWEATNEAWRFTPNGESNVEFAWYDQNGNEVTTENSFEVCPTDPVNYTARATYTNCNGDVVVAETNVSVEREMPYTVSLGEDQEVCDENVDSITLNVELNSDDLQISDLNYQWFLDGDIISGETAPSITVNESGIYTVETQEINGSCEASDNVVITFYETPEVANTPDLINYCYVDGLEEVDLTQNTSLVLGAQDSNDFTVSYYETIADAEAGTNVISAPDVYQPGLAEGCMTIYVRIENNADTSCY
ncbi:PKD domain-containing protein, partial [Mesonia aquimarina]|uniref:PKD domain-containing protein n=1 Tax=Mesonia aquimarina TaxID=1504967 RepID=UPI000EF57C0A